jgi:hypothetical protein
MSNNLRRLLILLAFLVSAVPGADRLAAGRKDGSAEPPKAALWRDPGDAASLNLLYGSGGEQRQPVGPFIFIQEDLEGSNPKFDVRDQNGVKWKVKLGAEARPEVAATRLVWAAGFYTTDDYFLPALHVQDLPNHLHRGQAFVSSDGVIHNVRLKRPLEGFEKAGPWQWGSNPFVDTPKFNALRVLMALINNWDLKDANNAIYERKPHGGTADPEQIYLISDLGATFGTTGFMMSVEGSRGNLDAYKHSKFISNATPDYVDFGAPSRPTLVETFNLPVFVHRLDLRWIGRHIPRADAKWLGMVLGRLSPDQIRDAFRAAGYSPQEVNDFATVVESRISALNAL